MKYIILRIKAGASLAPAYIIFLYLLFGFIDLLTTYIASPDLKYEGNWVVKKFSFSWPFLIVYASINYTIAIIAFVLALDYLDRWFKLSFKESFLKLIFSSLRNIKFLISLIILAIFYYHFINIGHIIFNNYLGYVYLKGSENWLKEISVFYIERQKYFLFYITYITFIPGLLIAFIKVNFLWRRSIVQGESVIPKENQLDIKVAMKFPTNRHLQGG